MNENPQNNNQSSGSSNQPEYHDRHEWRRRMREERWERRGGRGMGSAWFGGAILILIGIIILLQNFGQTTLQNWWALFILIPAVGSFGAALRIYQNAGGHLTAPARGSLIAGLVMVMVTAIFLFNLNWTWLGPIILILAGAGLLLNALLPG
jgi:hypothetical protein